MDLIPSIQIHDEQSLYYMKSEASATGLDPMMPRITETDPIAQAQNFAQQGFQWINIIDMNARRDTRDRTNHHLIRELIDTCDCKVQYSGGVRDLRAVDYWIACGAGRLIIRSTALYKPELLREAAQKYPGKIILGISVDNNRVATRYDDKLSAVKPLDMALKFDNDGLVAMIITDINREVEALSGINIDQLADMAFSLTTPLYASGGLSHMAELQDLKDLEHLGIAGVIAGRAFYDGRLDVPKALALFAQKPDREHLPVEDF